jgi:hypothetical protein
MKFAALLVFGVLSAAPATAVKRYVRVVQDQGVWWFVDAEGRKFFSTGVDCVGGCYGHSEQKPMQVARKGRILSQLKGWGFNTAGSWSSPSVYDSLYVADQIYHGVKAVESDVYDEALWTGSVEPLIKAEVQELKGLKTLIGYFIDNEHKWNGEPVFRFYLGLPAKAAGSKELLKFLASLFKNDIAKLNASLGTSYKSFSELPASRGPEKFSALAVQDVLKPWRTRTAAAFYGRYAATLRKLDPHHLVIGVRWAGLPDEDLYVAVSKYMDVDSVNDYNRYGELRPEYEKRYKITGKPVIISEWSFSGFEEGGFPSLQFIEVFNQKNRGVGYEKYTREAARAPFMVGMHWFLWNDYSKRDVIKNNDLPDENMGLVSSDERTTYTELAGWTTKANAALAADHAQSAAWRAPVRPEAQAFRMQAFRPKVDGNVSDWPAGLALHPFMEHALLPGTACNDTYYLSMDSAGVYVGARIADKVLVDPGPDWSWEGDNLAFGLTALDNKSPVEIASMITLHPTGGGKDKKQPYAFSWSGPLPYQALPMGSVQLAVKSVPTGIELEASIPAKLLEQYPGAPGQRWKAWLAYENIDGISKTLWEGIVQVPAEKK